MTPRQKAKKLDAKAKFKTTLGYQKNAHRNRWGELNPETAERYIEVKYGASRHSYIRRKKVGY